MIVIAGAKIFQRDSTWVIPATCLSCIFPDLAGTDDQRRDLIVVLLMGTLIALAFGILGAIVTRLLSMLIAVVGVWDGAWSCRLRDI